MIMWNNHSHIYIYAPNYPHYPYIHGISSCVGRIYSYDVCSFVHGNALPVVTIKPKCDYKVRYVVKICIFTKNLWLFFEAIVMQYAIWYEKWREPLEINHSFHKDAYNFQEVGENMLNCNLSPAPTPPPPGSDLNYVNLKINLLLISKCECFGNTCIKFFLSSPQYLSYIHGVKCNRRKPWPT